MAVTSKDIMEQTSNFIELLEYGGSINDIKERIDVLNKALEKTENFKLDDYASVICQNLNASLRYRQEIFSVYRQVLVDSLSSEIKNYENTSDKIVERQQAGNNVITAVSVLGATVGVAFIAGRCGLQLPEAFSTDTLNTIANGVNQFFQNARWDGAAAIGGMMIGANLAIYKSTKNVTNKVGFKLNGFEDQIRNCAKASPDLAEQWHSFGKCFTQAEIALNNTIRNCELFVIDVARKHNLNVADKIANHAQHMQENQFYRLQSEYHDTVAEISAMLLLKRDASDILHADSPADKFKLQQMLNKYGSGVYSQDELKAQKDAANEYVRSDATKQIHKRLPALVNQINKLEYIEQQMREAAQLCERCTSQVQSIAFERKMNELNNNVQDSNPGLTNAVLAEAYKQKNEQQATI